MFSQSKNERIAVFIDGDNLYGTLSILGWQMDFAKLRSLITADCTIYDCFYYTSWDDDEKKKNFAIFLINNGFTVKKRELQKIMQGGRVQKIKGNIDILMTLDIVVTRKNYDIAVLVTGDGDFCPVVEYLRSVGKRVVAISSKFEAASIELVNSVDRFIDLAEIREFVERMPAGYQAPKRSGDEKKD